MHFRRTTLSKFLIQQLRGTDESQLAALLVDVAAAVKAISAMAARGALGGDWDALAAGAPAPKSYDTLANDAILRYCEWGGQLAAMASADMDAPYVIPDEFERGPYLLLFDALHGAGGLDTNSLLGSVFSILRHPGAGRGAPALADFLQPGAAQVAAGYALYGPSTMLVLTVGKGTHGFTLDRETGNFLLTHPRMNVAEEATEININPGNERFWEPPMTRYVQECRNGATDVRQRDFKIRWTPSVVAQVHRVLIRGGVFAAPADAKDPRRRGRLRLLFGANPMAMLVEQAGGWASTGHGRLLNLQPADLHERAPAIMGSRSEIARIERYHREHAEGTDKPYFNPLFNSRSLFRETVIR